VSFEKFEEGDKVLFNNRKTPLTASKIEEERMLVKGQQEENMKYTMMEILS